MPQKRILTGLCAAWMVVGLTSFAHSDGATVLYNDQVIEIEQTLAAPTDLWVSPADLTRINDFELKPEGACLGELCIPAKQDEDSDLVVTRLGQKWVNVTELARKLQQGYAYDAETGVWSFGEIPAVRQSFLESGVAPDFALPDRDGNIVKLSDFRGKKVLIITWASW